MIHHKALKALNSHNQDISEISVLNKDETSFENLLLLLVAGVAVHGADPGDVSLTLIGMC